MVDIMGYFDPVCAAVACGTLMATYQWKMQKKLQELSLVLKKQLVELTWTAKAESCRDLMVNHYKYQM